MNDSTRRSESTARGEKEEEVSLDLEKGDNLEIDDEQKTAGYDAIRTVTSRTQRNPNNEDPSITRLPYAKSLRSVHSHRSYAGGDGYTHFNEEDHPPNISSGGTTAEPFVVTWDGDADPMNPRSMTTLRRWMIVLIVSSSSLCV